MKKSTRVRKPFRGRTVKKVNPDLKKRRKQVSKFRRIRKMRLLGK